MATMACACARSRWASIHIVRVTVLAGWCMYHRVIRDKVQGSGWASSPCSRRKEAPGGSLTAAWAPSRAAESASAPQKQSTPTSRIRRRRIRYSCCTLRCAWRWHLWSCTGHSRKTKRCPHRPYPLTQCLPRQQVCQSRYNPCACHKHQSLQDRCTYRLHKVHTLY